MPPPYSPPPVAGRPILYLPNIVVEGHPHALEPNDAPLDAEDWHEFPMPSPMITLPTELVCKQLTDAAIRTEKSQTTTAAQVFNMPVEDRLHVVRRCRTLWRNLQVYCDPSGAGIATIIPQGGIQVPANAQIPAVIHTGSQVISGLPDARQQADAVDRLFGWFTYHSQRIPAAMTSEPSIQDEVHAQIIEPLNMLLQVSI
jgi:hypothetical protein